MIGGSCAESEGCVAFLKADADCPNTCKSRAYCDALLDAEGYEDKEEKARYRCF